MQRTIGNQQVLRLLAGRTGAPQTRRPVVVQRYTEEDIQARAHKIYVLRTQGARPGGHTDANVQAGEKADWTRARRELDWIEQRAQEISRERRDHPDRFPSAAGPMSDWLTAEHEFVTQTGQPPTWTSQPAMSNQPAASASDPTLSSAATSLQATLFGPGIGIGDDLTPYLYDPARFANLRAEYRRKFASDLVSDVILKHQMSALTDTLRSALNRADGPRTCNALAALQNRKALVGEAGMLWRLLYGGTLEQEIRGRLGSQPEHLARALYFFHGPGAAVNKLTHLSPVGGVTTPAMVVDGGAVTASTGVAITTNTGQVTNMNLAFGFNYTGQQAPTTRWLQFMARAADREAWPAEGA